MKRATTWLVTAGLCAALSADGRAQPAPAPGKDIRRIDVTRFVLTHGRVDNVRSRGILTPENPRGMRVAGITTAVRQGQAVPQGTRATVLDAIAAQPDPLRVTLDLDADGKRLRNPATPSPLIPAGAIIPSGFTLVVAELANPLDRRVVVRWRELNPRFGKGNFYATISIPNTKIRRGMELFTAEHLDAYTANSILYEAPNIPFPIVSAQIEGGTTQVGALPRRAPGPPPPPPPRPVPKQKKLSAEVAWANPLDLRLIERGQQRLPPAADGRTRTRIWIRTNLPIGPPELRGPTLMPVRGELINLIRTFEPIPTRVLRVAAEANSGTRIFEVFGANTSLFFFDLPLGPSKPFQQPDTTVKFTAVASSWGFIGRAPPPGPFSTPLPVPPQRMALDTFHSWGCTLGDTITVRVKAEPAPQGQTVNGYVWTKRNVFDPRTGKVTQKEVEIGSISFTIAGNKVSGTFSIRDDQYQGGIYTASGSFSQVIRDKRKLAIFPTRIDEVPGTYEHKWQPPPDSREKPWSERGTAEFSARTFDGHSGWLKLKGRHTMWHYWRERPAKAAD